MNPLIEISGYGCIWKDIYVFQGVADATSLCAVKVTGSRNYFENCHFAGIGNDTMDAAGACSLKLDGAQECKFKACQIGLDTIARGTALNYELIFDSQATRNEFEDCLIYGYLEANTHCLVQVADAAALDRYVIFKNCTFLSESLNNATPMLSAFEIPAGMETCYIILKDCAAVGIADWDANNRGKVYANMIAPTAAAAGGYATSQ
jgi:hypothetical protein